MLRNFDEVIEKVKSFKERKRCGVCMADEAAIEAVIDAEKMGLVKPVFVGHKEEIEGILKKFSAKEEYEIIDVKTDVEGAQKVVELVREGKVEFILKGHIETAVLMRAVVDKEKGLRTSSLMSHVAFEEIPTYHKLLAVTDGGMCTYPDVDQKQKIVENAVEVFNKLGYACPKVACLSAIEKENPKMPSTVDAAELKRRNLNGEIKSCMVEGPISFDLAYSKEAKKIKEYDSQVAGDADILLVPDIQAGNILAKSLNLAARGRMAGFVVGAKCLILLISRSATAEEKYLSIAMAALVNQ